MKRIKVYFFSPWPNATKHTHKTIEYKCDQEKDCENEEQERERKTPYANDSTSMTERNLYTHFYLAEICLVILILTCDYCYDDLMKIFRSNKTPLFV